MVRKLLAKVRVYQMVNFVSHVIYKKPRTKKEYNTLVAGNYLRKWQGKILINMKAIGRKS